MPKPLGRSLNPTYEATEMANGYVITHAASGTVIASTTERHHALLIIRCLNEDIERIEASLTKRD